MVDFAQNPLRKTLRIWKSAELVNQLQTALIKGVVFFYFPGKDTFRMIFGKKEWVSEISGIFFFPLWRKKKYRLISHREKNPGLFFPKIVYFRQKKISVIFLSYRSPYFCQICGLQMKKLTSYFGQNWGSQTEIKKYRLISVKTVYFWRK